MPEFFYSLILILGGFTLLQFSPVWCRKAGFVLLWLSSGLAAYFLTHSYWASGLILISWIAFPLWEMVFILRQLRVPRDRTLADARAPQEDFEEIDDLTHELRHLGFTQMDECRVRPALHDQYFRLFLHQDGQTIASLSHLVQGPLMLHYVAFTTISLDERSWITWDYPMTYGLLVPDHVAMYRVSDIETVEELYALHQEFLAVNEITPDKVLPFKSEASELRDYVRAMINEQIAYNVEQGFLAPAEDAESEEGELRYSWRGTFYVVRKVLVELLF